MFFFHLHILKNGIKKYDDSLQFFQRKKKRKKKLVRDMVNQVRLHIIHNMSIYDFGGYNILIVSNMQ